MIGYRLVRYIKREPTVDEWLHHAVTGVATSATARERVTSIFKLDHQWVPGLNVASCISPYAGVLFGSPPRKHAVPDEDCLCGFYAWTDLLSAVNEHIRRQRARQHLVAIKVAASGKVIEHEHGWRAAEITPLAVIWAEGYSYGHDHTGRVAELLDVPLEGVDVEIELDSVDEWDTAWVAAVGQAMASSIDKRMKIVYDAQKIARELYGETPDD